MEAVAYLLKLVAGIAAVVAFAVFLAATPEFLGRRWLAHLGRSRADDDQTGRATRWGFLLLWSLMFSAMMSLPHVISAIDHSEAARLWRNYKAPPALPALIDSEGRIWDEQQQRWLSPVAPARLEQLRRELAEEKRQSSR